MLAQRTTIHYATDMGGYLPQVHTRDIIVPPCILQSATASVIHNAVQQHGGFSLEQIKRILEVRKFCMLGDTLTMRLVWSVVSGTLLSSWMTVMELCSFRWGAAPHKTTASLPL